VDGKDRKHAPMGVFSVLAVRDGEKTPNSQNVPKGARFGCWARGAGWRVVRNRILLYVTPWGHTFLTALIISGV